MTIVKRFQTYIYCCCDHPLSQRRHLGQTELFQENPQILCGIPPVNNHSIWILRDKKLSIKTFTKQVINTSDLLISSGCVLGTSTDISTVLLYGIMSNWTDTSLTLTVSPSLYRDLSV